MKKLLAALILIMCTTMVCAQTPSDVPQDHWAYDAVNSLIAKGFVQGYPDGTFQGTRTLSRYEFATVIKRLIDGVDEAIAKNQTVTSTITTSTPKIEVTKTDLETLTKLINEFKVELTVIGTRLDNVEAQVVELTTKVKTLEAITTDEEGPLETARNDIKTLKKIGVSGYVQARWEASQATGQHTYNTAKGAWIAPNGSNTFNVRRSRLKITGNPTSSTQAVIQVDAGGTAFAMKDAYIKHELAKNLYLQAGQFLWPFGFTVQQSSADRELPEQPQIVDQLFAGEYDRGATLTGKAAGFNWVFGVFNGAGSYKNDTNRDTDVLGRVTKSFGDIEVGASGYLGSGYKVGSKEGRKNRWGTDVRWYLPNITVKAEWIWGKNTEGAQVAKFDESINGGYVQVAYNVIKNYTLVVNWDHLSDDLLNNLSNGQYLDYGARDRYNVGVIRWLDDATRLKFFYEFNKEEFNPFRNNKYTVELITKY